MRFGRALKDAFRATSTLYNPEVPLGTNLWCTDQVVLEGQVWRAVNTKRARSLYDWLDAYVKSLNVRSVEYGLERDYFSKYYIMRNLYFPESLQNQAAVAKWYLGGTEVGKPVEDYLLNFWRRIVPKNYKMLCPEDIPCPRYEASGGVTLIWDAISERFMWAYVKKGPMWREIQEGTKRWLELVARAVPNDWLGRSIESLLGCDNYDLESLTVERPVIRKESGPGGVRWARSSSANLYELGRMIMKPIQDGVWSQDTSYIGKASNAQYAALRVNKLDDWYIGTHGDDWVAWCPKCQRWHSGDWSNFDLRVTARQLLASYAALYSSLESFLSETERKWFYASAYFAIRAPTIWLWNAKGERQMSVRRTLGKVRSGSGDFVMHNNAINSSVLNYVLRKVHDSLGRKREFPCRSKHWWSHFSSAADNLGWLAKPSAQMTHPHGFIACRCAFKEDRRYSPIPGITSVVRNWVNPAYDPNEYPNNTGLWLACRLRDLNTTVAWSPDDDGRRVMETVVDVALRAGVSDPYGMGYSKADLSRAMQQVVGLYSTSHYLAN